MNRITLLRHAKSSWKNPGLADFDRPLNKRGINDAPLMGKICSENIPEPDLILLSPAKRTRMTVDALLEGWNLINVPVVEERSLYMAGLDDWIDVVTDNKGKADHLLLCGHQPGIGYITRWLLPDFNREVPTAAVISILMANGRSGEREGKLDFYAVPRDYK